MADPSNVVIGYNSAVPESREIAELYLLRIGASATRAVPLECSTFPLVDSYAEFAETVESPLRGFASQGVSAYVLGYRVPVGFFHEGGVISACSRMSSPYPLSPGRINPAFTASGSNRPSSASQLGIVPCSSLDMPTAAASRRIAEFAGVNSILADVTGTLLLDPYPPRGSSSSYLQSAINEFDAGLGSILFPERRKSVLQLEPYESTFPYVVGDSFFYGWGLVEANESYFLSQQERRALFFNADPGSLARVRTSDGGFSSCVSAAASGYAFVAGSVGNAPFPDDDPYADGADFAGAPHPTPLFNSIGLGENAGEAFILAVPRLDTPFGCLGCPFGRFRIANGSSVVALPSQQIARETQATLSRLISRIDHSARASDDLLKRMANWDDQVLRVRLQAPIASFARDNGVRARKGMLQKLITSYHKFISQISYGKINTSEPTLLEYFEGIGEKISKNFLDYSLGGQQLLRDMKYTTFEKPGTWYVEFPLADMDGRLGFVHFQAEVYNEGGELASELRSYSDLSLWTYEAFAGRMVDLPPQGVFSGRVGAKIRVYSADRGSSLRQSELATVRIRQVLDRQYFSEWKSYQTVATS